MCFELPKIPLIVKSTMKHGKDQMKRDLLKEMLEMPSWSPGNNKPRYYYNLVLSM